MPLVSTYPCFPPSGVLLGVTSFGHLSLNLQAESEFLPAPMLQEGLGLPGSHHLLRSRWDLLTSCHPYFQTESQCLCQDFSEFVCGGGMGVGGGCALKSQLCQFGAFAKLFDHFSICCGFSSISDLT